MGNIFKKSLSVYDTWFGFYGDLKKGTLRLPYGKCRRKWVKDKALNKKDGSSHDEEILVVFMRIY